MTFEFWGNPFMKAMAMMGRDKFFSAKSWSETGDCKGIPSMVHPQVSQQKPLKR